MKKIFSILVLVTMSGCTTLHFDNGSELGSTETKRWHSNYAFALVEGSSPVDLKNECDDKEWSSVKTELTFINGLAGAVVNILGPIWYPKTVEVSCK